MARTGATGVPCGFVSLRTVPIEVTVTDLATCTVVRPPVQDPESLVEGAAAEEF